MTADELEAALRVPEPAARVVPARRLLRLVAYLRDHGRPLPLNPDPPVRVARADAVAADVLPAAALAGDEPTLLLLTAPDDRLLGDLPRPELLRAYWRLLFQDRVAGAARAAGPKAVAAAGDALGPAAVREIRYVLQSDHRIDPGADTGECFATFAAAFADLQVFDPPAVAEFFPSVRPEAARAAFAELGVDVPAALRATRPAGAAGPGAGTQSPAPADRPADGSVTPLPGSGDWADESYTRGNYVRAAILHTQAAANVRRKDRDREQKAARDHLGMLVHGLARACGWDRRTARTWKDALEPLLEPAGPRGGAPAAPCREQQ
ncbi:MAG: hypothetical protein K2X87_25020, partial [Gemmataceae bacterium]|nr:hypothetical protein [Gemmataceae bacterium]